MVETEKKLEGRNLGLTINGVSIFGESKPKIDKRNRHRLLELIVNGRLVFSDEPSKQTDSFVQFPIKQTPSRLPLRPTLEELRAKFEASLRELGTDPLED